MKYNSIGKKFVSSDDGVSPVIGTILMVAVVVILAAVIAAFVFGFVGNMPIAPNVNYFNIERVSNGSVVVTNTAPTVAEISNVVIMVGDNDYVLKPSDVGAASFAVLSDTYGEIVIPAYHTAVLDGDGNIVTPAGGLQALTSGPTVITVKASVNGAAIQVIQTIRV